MIYEQLATVKENLTTAEYCGRPLQSIASRQMMCSLATTHTLPTARHLRNGFRRHFTHPARHHTNSLRARLHAPEMARTKYVDPAMMAEAHFPGWNIRPTTDTVWLVIVIIWYKRYYKIYGVATSDTVLGEDLDPSDRSEAQSLESEETSREKSRLSFLFRFIGILVYYLFISQIRVWDNLVDFVACLWQKCFSKNVYFTVLVDQCSYLNGIGWWPKKKKKFKIILRSENPSKMKMHFFLRENHSDQFWQCLRRKHSATSTQISTTHQINDNSTTTYSDTQCVLELSTWSSKMNRFLSVLRIIFCIW